MSQMTFSDYAYNLRKRKTKREEFLDIMNEIYSVGRMGRICTPVLPKRQAWQTNKRNRKNAADVSCCRSGSISLTRVWKMPSMTAMHSGNS